MTTPRAFAARYGTPRARILTVTTTPTAWVQADLDRYLLLFWSTTAALQIRPGISLPASAPPHVWSGSEPLVLSHGAIGAAVCLPWTLSTAAGTATVLLLEGTMRAGAGSLPSTTVEEDAAAVLGAGDTGLSVLLAGLGLA